MDRNIGTADRVARVSFGLVLLAVATGLFGNSASNIWGWLGLIPLVSGLIGWCPLYSLIGLGTREAEFSDEK